MIAKSFPLFLLLALILNAQEILWSRQFDSGGDDYGGLSAIDPEGNIVLAGIINYFSGSDLLILKYSYDGDLIWQKVYDFEPRDDAYGITIDHSGNIILTGIYPIGSLWGSFILKLNPDGDTIWYRRYSSPAPLF